MHRTILLLTTILFLQSCKSTNINLPDPLRFKEEIANFENIQYGKDETLVVFTGSSSIRKWKDVQDYFPEIEVVNTGFGGSTMSDLLYYLDEAVLTFSPKKVVVYEGGNDVSKGIPANKIVEDAESIIKRIQKELPETTIILLSAKPTPGRWSITKKYEELNRKLEKMVRNKNNVHFVDVYSAMLDESGIVRSDIFLEDQIHMNSKGYELWKQLILEQLNK